MFPPWQMERVISLVQRSRLASLFFLRYQIRFLDGLVISLFATLVVGLRIAIAHVTHERREKAVGEVNVAIPRTHSHGFTARLYRTAVQHEYSRAGPQPVRPTSIKLSQTPSLHRESRT